MRILSNILLPILGAVLSFLVYAFFMWLVGKLNLHGFIYIFYIISTIPILLYFSRLNDPKSKGIIFIVILMTIRYVILYFTGGFSVFISDFFTYDYGFIFPNLYIYLMLIIALASFSRSSNFDDPLSIKELLRMLILFSFFAAVIYLPYVIYPGFQNPSMLFSVVYGLSGCLIYEGCRRLLKARKLFGLL